MYPSSPCTYFQLLFSPAFINSEMISHEKNMTGSGLHIFVCHTPAIKSNDLRTCDDKHARYTDDL